MPEVSRTQRREILLRGLTLSIDDVRGLVERLADFVAERRREVEREVPSKDLPEIKARLERGYTLWISVFGSDGEHLLVNSLKSVTAPDLPQEIRQIYINSIGPHTKEFGFEPLAGFELNLDFSNPEILDWQNAISGPTPNASRLMVTGPTSWTGAVVKCVEDHLKHCSNGREFLHRKFVYDLFLFTIGMPASFLAIKRLSPIVESAAGTEVSTLSVALNLYIFFGVIWLYRLIFFYSRWVAPTVELTHNKRNRAGHRIVLGLLLAALVGEMVHSVFVIASGT